MDTLLQDVRYGVRQLARQPGSSAVAVLTLALGIGVSTAIFSVIDATMLRPLPYPNPEQLVTVNVEIEQRDGRVGRPTPSMEDLRLWQQATDVFSSVAGSGGAFRGRIAEGPEPERLRVAHYTEDYLPMHGVSPILGRGFTREDTERVSVYARLQPGMTVDQARERLSAARIPSMPFPDGRMVPVRVGVESRLESMISRARTTINVLAGAVALILLIAVVNVAGLLLARGAARQSELAVRASLGARRGRLVRQLLTESAVLALPAAALGVVLAWLTLDLIVANLPMTMPANSPVTVNLKVLALTAALLVPTTLLFGLVPALRLSRVRIGSTMAGSGRQVGSSLSRRGSQALIAVEVALAVVLVAGAGLMIRSYARITAVDLGYNPDGLWTMQVLPLERDGAAHREYYWALQQRLRETPGIASVGIVDNFALGGGGAYTSVRAEGRSTSVTVFDMTPGYLETIGATLHDGRLPGDGDFTSGFRGVVLNESAARAIFPEGQAVGRELLRADDDTRPWTVLGVISDLRHGGPLADVAQMRGLPVFFPLEVSEYELNAAMTVVVRPARGVPAIGERLRQAAQDVGPRVLVERIQTADELFGATVITPRRRTVLLALLGGFGLVLALVGVFGMTAYAVARRTAEIGVRMAFGARPGQVVGTMLRDAATPIAMGTVAGVGGALLATRAIESFLFQTPPTDPVTLAVVAATLACAGCAAALVPALRAARVDPALTLRAE